MHTHQSVPLASRRGMGARFVACWMGWRTMCLSAATSRTASPCTCLMGENIKRCIRRVCDLLPRLYIYTDWCCVLLSRFVPRGQGISHCISTPHECLLWMVWAGAGTRMMTEGLRMRGSRGWMGMRLPSFPSPRK